MNRRESVIMTIQPEREEMPKKLTDKEIKTRTAEVKRGVAAAKKEVARTQKVCTEGATTGSMTKADSDEYRQAVSSHIKSLQALTKLIA